MNNDIRFSIIIPTYNRAELLKRAVNSVLNQDYSNFELIVVDDGSTDNTKEEIAPFLQKEKRISYYKKKNEERAVARNFGTKIAKGSYVNFLDSDDTLYPNHLSIAKKAIENLSAPEIVHLGYDIKTENGAILKTFSKNPDDPYSFLLKGNFMSCNGVFLRKDIALEFPFIEDLSFMIMEDWALWLKIGSRYTIHHIPKITSTIYEHHQRSVNTSDRDTLVKSRELFMKYLFNDKVLSQKLNLYRNQLNSNTYSYIALHLALQKKHRKDVIKYLTLAFLSDPRLVFQRRFYACIKHLI